MNIKYCVKILIIDLKVNLELANLKSTFNNILTISKKKYPCVAKKMCQIFSLVGLRFPTLLIKI
jgi:hypothetical protein